MPILFGPDEGLDWPDGYPVPPRRDDNDDDLSTEA
jgi:hypothetical protein